MRPVLSVLMTVTSSASSCSKFLQSHSWSSPNTSDVPSSKWMTSWFPGNEIITGILQTVLILIKSHFLKRWPQTSHFSHLRSNSSFPHCSELKSWVGKIPLANTRRLSNFSINLMCRPWLKCYPTQTTQMLKVQTYRNIQIDTDVLRSSSLFGRRGRLRWESIKGMLCDRGSGGRGIGFCL